MLRFSFTSSVVRVLSPKVCRSCFSTAKLYLGNVDAKNSEVIELCNKLLGKPSAIDVRFGKHSVSGTKLDYCFVNFDSPKNRDAAIDLLDGFLLNGRELGARSGDNSVSLPLNVVLFKCQAAKELNQEAMLHRIDEIIGRKCVKSVRKSSSGEGVFWVTFHSIAGSKNAVQILNQTTSFGSKVESVLYFVPPTESSVRDANNIESTLVIRCTKPLSPFTLKLSGKAVRDLSATDVRKLCVSHVGEAAVVGVREMMNCFSDKRLYCLVDFDSHKNLNKTLQLSLNEITYEVLSRIDVVVPGCAVLLRNLPSHAGDISKLIGELKPKNSRKGVRTLVNGETQKCLLMDFNQAQDAAAAQKMLHGAIISGNIVSAQVV